MNSLSQNECREKADELVICLGLWDINVNNARSIVHMMLSKLNKMSPLKPIPTPISEEAKARLQRIPMSEIRN